MKSCRKVIKRTILLMIVLFSGFLAVFCTGAQAAISFKSSKNVPDIYLEIIKRKIDSEKLTLSSDIEVVLGEEAFEQALKESRSESKQLLVLYISRYAFDRLMIKYGFSKNDRISALFFDPSFEQQLDALRYVANNTSRKFDTVLLNSWQFAKVFVPTSDDVLDISVRTRLRNEEFSALLTEGYNNKIFVVPADEQLLQDVLLGDFISLLLDNQSGLVTFSSNINNSLISVYFRLSDYANEFVLLMKKKTPFIKYPEKAYFKINPKVALAIGVDLKDTKAEGYVKDVL